MPQQQTDTIRLLPVGQPYNRQSDPDKDQRFKNCYIETTSNPYSNTKKQWLVKRPGLSQYNNSSVTAEARGAHYWTESTNLFTVWGNTLYKDGTAFYTFTTNTGKVGFCEAIYGLKEYLFIADGKKGYLIDKDSPTAVNMIDNTSVLLATVTAGGSAYASAPTVTIAAPSLTAWATATAYALGDIRTSSSNVYICVTAGTSHASTTLSGTGISISDGTAVWRYVCTTTAATATATATVAAGAVTAITITNAGYGYGSAPTVSFSGGGGSGAAAVATLNALPVNHRPTPVFLDGYIFLAKEDTADIYNSGIGDYDYWNPVDYLSVAQYSDSITGLAKQNNQVVALKESSIEYLYDAGNAFGSPLARTTQAVIQIGCGACAAIVDAERRIYFVGKSDTGSVGVWQIEGFKESKVSTEAIDRILQAEGAFISSAYGYPIRINGHYFYVLRLYNGRTLVYDQEEQFWSEWSSVESSVEGNFVGKFATAVGTLPVVQHATNGKTYSLSASTYTDATGVIKLLWTSIPIDMENTYRKWFQSLTFVGDQQTSTSNMTVKYSDDDYKTWSSGWTINLQERAYIKRLGSARRRAFKLEHEADTPVRMEALEIVYLQGEH